MKISQEDFEQMKAKYDQEIKKGKSAKSNGKDIDDQTNWIYYTKEDLFEALNQEGVQGLRFYFTEYTKEVAEKFYGPDAEAYVGRLGMVYSPMIKSSENDAVTDTNGGYYDRGMLCPPVCQ
ncbi:hypothetical protein [Algoriphagus sanaruensis]|uniref:Uncharacterized protein n=1 Tax=Algoriphagus sanaruensis TaxID=1727163 RepID=A0A142EK36_9BACT|nr:hypothetical protein [Algoriphagus sanaruensis]AMQ55491.1 hypothetical protein AO498_03690 [Algoriphagus sanaruensis]